MGTPSADLVDLFFLGGTGVCTCGLRVTEPELSVNAPLPASAAADDFAVAATRVQRLWPTSMGSHPRQHPVCVPEGGAPCSRLHTLQHGPYL